MVNILGENNMATTYTGSNSSGKFIGSDDKEAYAAYGYGGVELLAATLQQDYAINIDRYVIVNFYSFIEIVDAVGGLDFLVTGVWRNAKDDVRVIAHEALPPFFLFLARAYCAQTPL